MTHQSTATSEKYSATRQPIELLAPAGDWDCARAAVENGADAIYFGLDVGFNARARATNFHLDDLPRLMAMLHHQSVRGYVTLNTLVFTDELAKLESHVRQLVSAGVDAVLVQDLGVAKLLRQLCPELDVHASTQMTITSAAAIRMAAQLGVRRVVLARELSLKEIRSLSAESPMPLEVFVHGALCVAYSGQCLTSESFGGRSANRGQCAQACRLPYELICDGEDCDLGDMKYLLSPQDLAAYDLIADLIDAGVCSMKIEGRLKTPEYVANICQHYRAAIDAALAGQPRKLSVPEQRDMELSFSRGFSRGWLEGCDHKRLVPGLSSAKRGVLMGAILQVRGDAFRIDSSVPLAVGDGIVLEGDRFAGREIGGRIYELVQLGRKVPSVTGGMVEVFLQRGTFHEQEGLVGKRVWKTDDPKLARRLRATFESPDAHKRVPVDVHVNVTAGQPIQVTATCPDGTHLQFSSDHVTEAARKHPLTVATLEEQFARLGGSVYQLAKLDATIDGAPMVPLSVLGVLRKQLIEQLDAARATVTPRECQPEALVPQLLDCILELDEELPEATSSAQARLIVLCRSLQQLEQTLACGVREVIADFHDLRQYAQAAKLAHAQGANLLVSTLRIHKPGEDGLFRMLAKSGADGWLVRSLAGIEFALREQIPFVADFALNIANPLTAQQFMAWGAKRITLSYDLNRAQLIQLASFIPSAWMEVVIHQHMPMFHMEHCVFCSTLSPGKNKSDCGRPCDRHDVKLRDRVGMEHVLHADIGCRNTLFNAQAQSGAEIVPDLLSLGLTAFRIELLRDAEPAETEQLIQLYQQLLTGERTGADVWRTLRADNRVGVTRGTLDGPKNPLAIL
ncbi:MAG: U32 family peptidase [Pirellulaceae bacterium]|nr:U32 family peptidase [Pirellulaceae bacterium]